MGKGESPRGLSRVDVTLILESPASRRSTRFELWQSSATFRIVFPWNFLTSTERHFPAKVPLKQHPLIRFTPRNGTVCCLYKTTRSRKIEKLLFASQFPAIFRYLLTVCIFVGIRSVAGAENPAFNSSPQVRNENVIRQ